MPLGVTRCDKLSEVDQVQGLDGQWKEDKDNGRSGAMDLKKRRKETVKCLSERDCTSSLHISSCKVDIVSKMKEGEKVPIRNGSKPVNDSKCELQVVLKFSRQARGPIQVVFPEPSDPVVVRPSTKLVDAARAAGMGSNLGLIVTEFIANLHCNHASLMPVVVKFSLRCLWRRGGSNLRTRSDLSM